MIVRLIGQSMWPILKEGRVVKVNTKASIDSLRPFDIIIFQDKDEFICHYFWKRPVNFHGNKRLIVTRPFNPVRNMDRPIEESQFIGQVIGVTFPWWAKIKVIGHGLIFKCK